jgi:Lar family restriction alleviation protein
MTQEFEARLLPCPFCGGSARVTPDMDYKTAQINEAVIYIECACCEAGPNGSFGEPRKEAIAVWNTRFDADALQRYREEIERLRADAARYAWLRDVSVPPHSFYISVPDEDAGVRYQRSDVDAYIDAARAALNPKDTADD